MHAEVLDGLAFRLIDQIHNANLKQGSSLIPKRLLNQSFHILNCWIKSQS